MPKKKNNTIKSVSIAELDISDASCIRKIGNHGIYLINNGNKQVDKKTHIYRYTSLNTLFKILDKETLHIPNIRSFSDLIEVHGLPRSVAPSRNYTEIDSHWVWQWKERIRKSALVCASCWTLDNCDGKKGVEQFLMWKAYGGGIYCCRMGTTIGKLTDSIKDAKYDIVIGDMLYGDNCIQNTQADYIFHKTIHYASEQEVRMAILYNKPQGLNLKVDVSSLFTEIKVSPFLPRCLSETIVGQLRKKLHNTNVDRSSIKEYEYLEYLNETDKRVNGKRP
ncbi:MAG: hypothetical protein J5711_03770 [Bacteroidales bacterium]|nr:hypothetical protein [Bacteroidales bacterium]